MIALFGHRKGSVVTVQSENKVTVRFIVSTVDSEGADIALIRLPRPATTILEDSDENVLPVCIDWSGSKVIKSSL